MTGFGRAIAVLGGADAQYGVEARSVNHRYLDVRLRLPRELGPLESEVRARVAARLSRGRVDLNIQPVGGDASGATGVAVNMGLVESLSAAWADIAKAVHPDFPPGPDVARLLAWPGVVISASVEFDPDEIRAPLLAAVDAALDALVEMRSAEGAGIAEELNRRLDSIAALTEAIEARAPALSEAYQARLRQRIDELVVSLGVSVDEGRILHEVAIFAEKADVAEEVARLRVHVEQARGHVASDAHAGRGNRRSDGGGGVGRRLDFLCQEMNREANTVGSKIQDVGVSETVIELKAELERLREQTQNVE